VFPVWGKVINQRGDGESAWDVYLDYDNDGLTDFNEPVAKTNRKRVP
jgi:hypothetical protein